MMCTEILLPKIGFGVVAATIAQWLVADGARVEEGQAIYNVENDKAVEEVTAPIGGTIRILIPAGEQCPVGSVVGEIVP